MFEDKRMDQTVIGTRRDSSFVTTDNVAQWISKALADELARNGMQVSYSASVNEARKGNPDFMVTSRLIKANIRNRPPPIWLPRCGPTMCLPTAGAHHARIAQCLASRAPACPQCRWTT